MTLIKCPECGKDVSNTCDQCIHCGYRLIKTTPKIHNNDNDVMTKAEAKFCIVMGFFSFVLGIVLIIVISYFVFINKINFWNILWLFLFVLVIIIGIISLVKGINHLRCNIDNE